MKYIRLYAITFLYVLLLLNGLGCSGIFPQSQSTARIHKLIFDISIGEPVVSSPLCIGDLIIVPTSHHITAFHYKNARQQWRTKYDQSINCLTSYQRVLYAGSDNGLHALSSDDGTPLWKVTAEGGVRFPAVRINAIIYFPDWFGAIMAVDAKDGTVLWKKEIDYAQLGAINVDDNVIIAGTHDGIVYGLERCNGSYLWEFHVSSAVWSQPVIDNGVAYLGSDGGILYALNTYTGQLIWKKAFNTSIRAAVALDSTCVYAVSLGGDIICLEKKSGTVKWQRKYESFSDMRYKPLIERETILIGTGWPSNSLCAISSRDGSILFSYTVGGPVYCTPILREGKIYYTYNNYNNKKGYETEEGKLIAIKL